MKNNKPSIEVISSFKELVDVLRDIYTTKNWIYVMPLMIAWIMLTTSRTVTKLYKMTGMKRYYSNYHRFFSEYRWDTRKAACKIMILCWKVMGKPEKIKLICDDTVSQKIGEKIFGVGVHSIKADNKHTNKANKRGHSWVVVGILIEIEDSQRRVCIPLLADLYVRRCDCKYEEQFKTRLEIAKDLLEIVITGFEQGIPEFKGDFVLLADGGYGKKPVLMAMKTLKNVTVISILRHDMRLYKPNPSRNNREAKHGAKLPAPSKILTISKLNKIKVSIYSKERVINVHSFNAYLLGYEGVVKIVIVKGYGKKTLNIFCTDIKMSDKEIIEEYAKRWLIEVMFRDSKQHMSFGKAQATREIAIKRQTNFGLMTHAIVELWYLKEFRNNIISETDAWYKKKKSPSFEDKLNTLRSYIAINMNYQVWFLLTRVTRLKRSVLKHFQRA